MPRPGPPAAGFDHQREILDQRRLERGIAERNVFNSTRPTAWRAMRAGARSIGTSDGGIVEDVFDPEQVA